MTGPGRAVAILPVPLLRDAVAREVSTLSLRGAAGEIGISPNALRNFLRGATPRTSTRVKLEAWLSRRTRRAKAPTVGALVRLVDAVGADLSPRQAAALGREIAVFLLDAYHERRQPPPRWVRELVHRYGVRPS